MIEQKKKSRRLPNSSKTFHNYLSVQKKFANFLKSFNQVRLSHGFRKIFVVPIPSYLWYFSGRYGGLLVSA